MSSCLPNLKCFKKEDVNPSQPTSAEIVVSAGTAAGTSSSSKTATSCSNNVSIGGLDDAMPCKEARMQHTREWLQSMSTADAFHYSPDCERESSEGHQGHPYVDPGMSASSSCHSSRDHSKSKRRRSLPNRPETCAPACQPANVSNHNIHQSLTQFVDSSLSSSSTGISSSSRGNLGSKDFFSSESDSTSYSSVFTAIIKRSVPGLNRPLHAPAERGRRSHHPSSIHSLRSGSSFSLVSVETEEVTLEIEGGYRSARQLGITVVCHSNEGEDNGIFVGSVINGGAAELSGKIRPGAWIVEVNGVNLALMSNQKALEALQSETAKGGQMRFVIGKCWDMEEPNSNDDHPESPYRELASSSTLKFESNTLDPRRLQQIQHRQSLERLRLERRSSANLRGLGPADKYGSNPGLSYAPRAPSRSSSRSSTGRNKGPSRLNSSIARQIRMFSSRARDQIDPLEPFVGSDLVDWIQQYVEEFSSSTPDAVEYASMLCATGYIKPLVSADGSNHQFSQQGMYVFGTTDLNMFV